MDVLDIGDKSARSERSPLRFSSQGIKMKQIDAAIQKCMEGVVALRIQRNECAPISCLPVEIMAKIFLIVKELTENSETFLYHHQAETLRWMNVSHVSTVWRRIAINFAGLWTEPLFWNKDCAEEMIRRAKHSVLNIRIDFKKSYDSVDVVRQIWPSRGQCVRKLILKNVSDPQWDWFWENMPTRLVRLESLQVIGRPLDTHFLLPAAIFSGANKIFEVRFDQCRVDLAMHLPPSITVLELENVKTVSPSTFLQLINALEGLQALEVLKLRYSLDSFPIDNSRLHQVNFPKLQKLSIHSCFVDKTALFFHSITFPSNICLYVNVRGGRSSPNDVQKVKEMLAGIGQSYIYRPSDLPPELYVFCDSRTRSIRLSFLDSSGPSLEVEISFIEIGSTGLTDFFFALFHSGLPLQGIRVASIYGLEGVTASALAETLGCLPNLSRITAKSASAELLVQTIQHPVGGSTELYFANLSILELNDVEFDSVRNGDGKFISALQDSLILRYEYNVEISRLVLRKCYQLKSYMVELLKEIVVDVDWVSSTLLEAC